MDRSSIFKLIVSLLIAISVNSQLPSMSAIHGATINKCLAVINGHIVTGGGDQTIKAWTEISPSVQVASLMTGGITPLKFVSGKTLDTLISSFDDGSVSVVQFTGLAIRILQQLKAVGPIAVDISSIDSTDLLIVLTSNAMSVMKMSDTGAVSVLECTPSTSGSLYTVVDYLRLATFIYIGTSAGELEVRHQSLSTYVPQVTMPGAAVAISAIKTVWIKAVVLIGYSNGNLIAVKTDAPNSLTTIFSDHDSQINSIHWIPQSNYAASGDQSGTLKIWNINTLATAAVLSSTYPNTVNVIKDSNTLKYLLIGKILAGGGAFEVINPTGLACYHTCTGICADYSRNTCTGCQAGFTLNANSFCQVDCTASQYNFLTNNTCLACHRDCDTCYDASSSHCLTCSNGKYLSTSKACEISCPTGEYQLNSTHCALCHASCLTCTNSSAFSCITCMPGKVIDIEGNCVDTCSDGSYRANDTHCGICHASCVKCKSGTENDCLTCKQPDRYRKSTDDKCIDCISESYLDKEICNMTRDLHSLSLTKWNYDLNSAISLQLFIENRAPLHNILAEINSWHSILHVS